MTATTGRPERAVLRLHDTMTRAPRALEPLDGETLRFYCCGPTVYGPAHIGNFRSFVVQDLFRRVVEAGGTPTRHVRNLTDVDDKTIRQSQAEGRSLQEFTADWTARFHADCEALHILPPAIEPGAVAHIPQQIALIEKLMEKGHAYVGGDGSVYFRIASFPAYGKLSRLQERTITTTDPGAALQDEYDRDSAADFALWKARRPEDGPNYWPSPWGEGRPGWHIECSAMAMEYLGPSFDLHGGGVDLIFPHHENEIAQSEAATGQPFAAHWFHVAHLLVEGKKMSKSLGNLFTLEDVRERGFSPEDLRYLLLSGHYRQPLNFTWESLNAARKALGRLRETRRRWAAPDFAEGQVPAVPAGPQNFGPFRPVLDALLDDLNTPEALGRLFVLLRKDAPEASDPAWRAGLEAVLWTFGFHLPPPAEVDLPVEIQTLADQRWQAKQAKDWSRADALRAELLAAGWEIKDRADGFDLSPRAK
jgi:cysteinyl-tRNA synthetase